MSRASSGSPSSELRHVAELLADRQVASSPSGMPRPPSATPMPAEALARAAELVQMFRKLSEVFGERGELFGDPAFSILLDLYCAQGKGRQVTVGDACVAAQVPPTSALRWLNSLHAHGLLLRAPDTADRRRQLVTLSDQGMLLMTRFLRTVG